MTTKPGSNAGASGAGAAGKGALSEVAKLQVTRENIEKEKRFFHLIETFSANPKTGMFRNCQHSPSASLLTTVIVYAVKVYAEKPQSTSWSKSPDNLKAMLNNTQKTSGKVHSQSHRFVATHLRKRMFMTTVGSIKSSPWPLTTSQQIGWDVEQEPEVCLLLAASVVASVLIHSK